MHQTLLEQLDVIDRILTGQADQEATEADITKGQRLAQMANAAPTLLVACRAALRLTDPMHPPFDLPTIRRQLHAAIARAEGR